MVIMESTAPGEGKLRKKLKYTILSTETGIIGIRNPRGFKTKLCTCTEGMTGAHLQGFLRMPLF